MDVTVIDYKIDKQLAHSINPTAPEHEWYEVADLIYLTGRRERIWYCKGCPLEKRILRDK